MSGTICSHWERRSRLARSYDVLILRWMEQDGCLKARAQTRRDTVLTDYQKTKFDTYFRHLDRDGSGAVEWADFETVVENIRAAKGWSAEEARYQRLVEAQRDYWQKITERVDKDGDGKVSPAEFNAFHESVGRDIEEHGRPPAWAVALVHAYHRMLDTAGNGTIDEDEYGVYL